MSQRGGRAGGGAQWSALQNLMRGVISEGPVGGGRNMAKSVHIIWRAPYVMSIVCLPRNCCRILRSNGSDPNYGILIRRRIQLSDVNSHFGVRSVNSHDHRKFVRKISKGIRIFKISGCQFHHHFMSSFFTNFLLPQYYKAKLLH